MNKKNLRKGFTTVELVIVIAVIAILATALIPTFSGLIDSANETKAMSKAREIYNEYLLENAETGDVSGDFYIKAENKYFKVTNGQLSTKADNTITKDADVDAGFEIYTSATQHTTGSKPCADTKGAKDAENNDIADGKCDTCGKAMNP